MAPWTGVTDPRAPATVAVGVAGAGGNGALDGQRDDGLRDELDEPAAIVQRLEIGPLLCRQGPADAIGCTTRSFDGRGPERDQRTGGIDLEVDLSIFVGAAS